MIQSNSSLNRWFQLMARKGYKVFDDERRPYNLNIIGFRSESFKLDKFNDSLSVVWKNAEQWIYASWRVTTLPGRHYLINELLNTKGSAILVPGQYRGAYRIGRHRGLEALVQSGPVRVYRDGNRDMKPDYNKSTIDRGYFGINIHRAGFYSQVIGRWSAGCQVFQRLNDFKTFMELCHKSASNWGNSFTYTLLEEKDMRENEL